MDRQFRGPGHGGEAGEPAGQTHGRYKGAHVRISNPHQLECTLYEGFMLPPLIAE
jgi:hypothetical protein